MRLVRTHKTAFNRQISESVEIRTQKKEHLILNSKSEYNRCALPRLTAKVGEESYGKLEKGKREEKEAEKELEQKIRAIRVKKNQEKKEESKQRREEIHQLGQPAEKRRKLNKFEYKRVLEQKKEAWKRERQEEKMDKEKTYEIFTNVKRRKTEKETKNQQTGEEESKWEKAWTQEEWLERIKEKQKELEKEEMDRLKRIEQSKRLQQGWELMRLCKEMMEVDGYKWKISKERRDMERNKLEEKQAKKGRNTETEILGTGEEK